MQTSSEFLSRFDPVGRYLGGDGTLSVAFLTNQGRQYPGTLTFRSGLCVAMDMEGSSRWAYPDETPLTGLRLLLAFEDDKPLTLMVDQGRVRTLSQVEMDDFLEDPRSVDAAQFKFAVSPRARTALLSLPEADRYDVLQTVARFAETVPGAWPADKIHRLTADGEAYLARVSDKLQAFLLVSTGRLELFDIVSKATLERFLERTRAAGAV